MFQQLIDGGRDSRFLTIPPQAIALSVEEERDSRILTIPPQAIALS